MHQVEDKEIEKKEKKNVKNEQVIGGGSGIMNHESWL